MEDGFFCSTELYGHSWPHSEQYVDSTGKDNDVLSDRESHA
ncbi:MAG: hypothetical protein AAFY57_04460 [Cyanobacteria bacterium J06642_2]